MKNYLKRIVLSGLIINLLAGTILAQTIWMQNLPKSGTQLDIKTSRPFFKNDSDLSLLSATSNITLYIPVHRNINIIGSLPVGVTNLDKQNREYGIGNLFLGFQAGEKNNNGENIFVTGGIYIPTISRESLTCWSVGMFSNLCDPYNYIPEAITLYSNLSYHIVKEKGFNWGLEIGPRLYSPVSDFEFRKTQLYGNYGIKGGYNTGGVMFGCEILGYMAITQKDIDFNDRFYNTAVISAGLTKGKVRPSVFYSKALKKGIFGFMYGVAGVKVEFSF